MPIPAMPALAPLDPPLQVVLVSPQIPPNTGNVARTCAVAGAGLHLVGPLGFDLSDRSLRRAGLDYCRDVAPEDRSARVRNLSAGIKSPSDIAGARAKILAALEREFGAALR
jgi:tRNA(Leu) C34 or U34 (ribose-2'-O)-methylase TrmL